MLQRHLSKWRWQEFFQAERWENKKKAFQFFGVFFLTVRKYREIFCWDFFFHFFFATLEKRTKWKYINLQEYNFSNISTGEIIYCLPNLRKFLEGCSFFKFLLWGSFLIKDYAVLSKLISEIFLHHIAGFTCLFTSGKLYST